LKNKYQKINIITLGCAKNVVDSEVLAGKLKAGNYLTYQDSDKASDIVIINTCGFINDAKQESIDTILQYVQAKKQGLVKKIFVIGCLSQRYKNNLIKEIPEVDEFFGVEEFEKISEKLGIDYNKVKNSHRKLNKPNHFAYLKIADGCNRNCSFCAIPLIKGKHVSRPIEELVDEAKSLADNGVKELILIAQDTTYYGFDIYKKQMLGKLLNELSKIEKLEWIRIHYTYPASFPDDVLQTIKKHKKICSYIDIPFQHISESLLKSMRRGYSEKDTYKLINTLKTEIPDVAIRTTLIVGYPGETEEDFRKLVEFVKNVKFDRLGVFTYSHEEDTFAYSLKDDVPDEVKQQRANEIMEIQQQISLEKNSSKIGKTFKTLIDRKEGNYYIGRTEYDSPEIDNEVLIKDDNDELSVGEFYDIKIIKSDFFDLYGKLMQ